MKPFYCLIALLASVSAHAWTPDPTLEQELQTCALSTPTPAPLPPEVGGPTPVCVIAVESTIPSSDGVGEQSDELRLLLGILDIPQTCGDPTCGTDRQNPCCGKMANMINHCTSGLLNSDQQAFLKCLGCRESSCNPNADTGSHFGAFQYDSATWTTCHQYLDTRAGGWGDRWREAGCTGVTTGKGGKNLCCASICAGFMTFIKGEVCDRWQVAAACMKQKGLIPPGGDSCKDALK